jgi:hypothetical protein
MNNIVRGTFLAVFLACATAAHAAAYKCTDDAGHTVYSDVPCAKKPPPKVEPVKVDAPVGMVKITEADVVHVLDNVGDLTRQNDAASLCDLFADDLKFRINNQGVKPPQQGAGGKADLCKMSRDNAERAKKANTISAIERGPTKVVIAPGETHASATYASTVTVTHYDVIVSTYHCTSNEQWGLYNGKLLYSAMEGTCKP